MADVVDDFLHNSRQNASAFNWDDDINFVLDADHSGGSLFESEWGDLPREEQDQLYYTTGQLYTMLVPPIDGYYSFMYFLDNGKAFWLTDGTQDLAPDYLRTGWTRTGETGGPGTYTYEYMVTPWEVLSVDGPDASTIVDLEEGKIIGIGFLFKDYDVNTSYEGSYDFPPMHNVWRNADLMADFVLMPVTSGDTVVTSPVVRFISPTSGTELGGTPVTIRGINFQDEAIVTFRDTNATNIVVVPPNTITATIPAHPLGTVDVIVTNPDGQADTLFNGFTFAVAPVVTSIDPTSGKEIGLTSVTITGSNFQSGATVTFGGRAATNVVVVSPTVITATAPFHSPGTVDVIVTNPDGLSGTLEDGFTFPVFAAPVVTSINSTSGPRRGGRPVTIEGSNFQSGATLVFGRSRATTVVIESPTVISAMTPSRRDGTVDVTVTNPDGQAGTLEGGYTFSDAQELPVRELRQVFAANRFVEPVLLTHAGDESDRIFVVERAGLIKVMPNRDDAVATDFLDLRDQVNASGFAGLLSMVFHPEHGTNGLFYVTYSRGNFFSRVSEFRVSVDPNVADVNSERVLLEVPQTGFQHDGDHLAFGPDGMLYISQGTGGGVPEQFLTAQDPTNLKGSILRIDVDVRTAGLEYGIPADNPFVGNNQDWREEIWAYGLRNPWRFSFDRKSGLLWLGDVAWGLWEEIIIIEKGANYGWPMMGGSQCNSSLSRNTAIAGCDRNSLALPAFEYGHSDGTAASVTGGYVYRGAHLSGLYGVYIYGDFVFKRIWGLRYEEGEVRSNNRLATSPSNPSSFGEDESGEVYIIGYVNGQIYTFEPLPGEMPTAVLSEESELPRAHALHQNYPNPFNPQTVIHYDLPVGGHVDVSIFNLMGQKVSTLVDGHRSAGSYSLVWDGKDDNQKSLASGVYLYRMETDGFAQTRKLLLLR